MRKQKRDKLMAKIVWNIITTITILSVIILFAAIGTMVENMMLTFPVVFITAICCLWIALYCLFITWAES